MDAVVASLDRARAVSLKALGPWVAPFVRSRELRVAASLSGAIVASLTLTAVAPLELLALGPIALGVPHLAADVRYLVLRPGLHRRPEFWLATVVPLTLLGVTAEGWLGWLAVLGAVVALPARAPRNRSLSKRRWLVAACAIAALAAARGAPRWVGPGMAHLHNLVAVAFFALWPAWVGRRRASRWHAVPIGLFVLASAAIFAGGLDAAAKDIGRVLASDGFGTPLEWHEAALAPREFTAALGDAFGLRLVLFFAFSQSVHYAVWLRAVPEEDRPRETPRTFRASIEAMREDGSWPVMWLFGALAMALSIWAAFDLHAARVGYLRGALFHGYLELAIAAALFASPEARLGALGPRRAT